MLKSMDTGFALKIAPWLAILLSGGLWAGALAFEHLGGYTPCQMCYWQRHAHKAVLVIAGLMILARVLSKDGTWDKVFMMLIGIAFAVSFGLAFWHMGVEYKWWDGPKSCMALPPSTITASDISKIFEKGVKLPACSDAPWHMFKISMAGYNALFSGFAALIGFQVAFKGNTYD